MKDPFLDLIKEAYLSSPLPQHKVHEFTNATTSLMFATMTIRCGIVASRGALQLSLCCSTCTTQEKSCCTIKLLDTIGSSSLLMIIDRSSGPLSISVVTSNHPMHGIINYSVYSYMDYLAVKLILLSSDAVKWKDLLLVLLNTLFLVLTTLEQKQFPGQCIQDKNGR